MTNQGHTPVNAALLKVMQANETIAEATEVLQHARWDLYEILELKVDDDGGHPLLTAERMGAVLDRFMPPEYARPVYGQVPPDLPPHENILRHADRWLNHVLGLGCSREVIEAATQVFYVKRRLSQGVPA